VRRRFATRLIAIAGIFGLLGLLGVDAARAETWAHELGAFTWWLPDDWHARNEENRMTASSPNGDMTAMAMVVPARPLEALVRGLAERVSSSSPAVVFGAPVPRMVNGMAGLAMEGTSRDGRERLWLFGCELPSHRAVLLLVRAEAGHSAEHVDVAVAILASPRLLTE